MGRAYARAGKRLAVGPPKLSPFQKWNASIDGCAGLVTMPNTTGNQEPFVERVEMAIMQYVILDKAQQGEVTRDNLKQTFKGNLQMTGDHFDHCINELVQDGHLKEVGGSKYTATDDGREDLQKLQTIVLELPNVIQQGGGQQKQGMTQQKSAAGGSSAGGGGGGSTGSTVGNQGSYGSSKPQGRDAGSQQGSTQPGQVSGQSGVSGQQRTADVNKGGATRTER